MFNLIQLTIPHENLNVEDNFDCVRYLLSFYSPLDVGDWLCLVIVALLGPFVFTFDLLRK